MRVRYIGTANGDVREGGDGADYFDGAGGNDRLFGHAGTDRLFGGEGNDLLSAGGIVDGFTATQASSDAEQDRVDGGAGDDVVAGGWNDVLIGGSGVDSLYLDLRGATAGVRLDLSPLTAGRAVRNGTGSIAGFEAYASITGSDFADDIRVGSLAVFSVLGGGIYGGAGNDRIDAGVYGASTNNALYARRLDGGEGDDLVIGSRGSDTLVGGDGDDRLVANDGNDTIYAGAGDDTIDVTGFGSDRADGGDGTDLAILSGTRADWQVRIDPSDDGLKVMLDRDEVQPNGAAGRTVTIENVEAVRFEDGRFTLARLLTGFVVGTAGDDRLVPGARLPGGYAVTAGDDTLYGLGGDDELDGGAGADTYYGGAGADTFYLRNAGDRIMDAGSGDVVRSWISYESAAPSGWDGPVARIELMGSADLDVLDYYGAGTIVGNAGDNHLTGSGVIEGGVGDDIIQGAFGATASYEHAAARVVVSLAIGEPQNTRGAGTDTLAGIAGLIGSRWNDVLTGSAGDDTIEGGLGDDRLAGGTGVDTLSYAHAASGVTVSLAIKVAQDTGGAGIDTATGFEALAGSAHADRLSGSDRADVLMGGAGDDVLAGGGDYDQLDGGAGNDTLFGGASYDSLTGGAGADRFVFEGDVLLMQRANGIDSIADYDRAQGDIIDLSAIDADASATGDQALAVVAAFTGRAGELALVLDPNGYPPTLQGDVDGDGLGDFRIALSYTITAIDQLALTL